MFKNKGEIFAFLSNIKQIQKELKLPKSELEILRDDIYDLILKAGDLVPRECLFLHENFSLAKLAPKPELSVYVDTANKYLDSMQSADEKLLFAELKAVCLMLNGDENALLEYAKIVMKLKFNEISQALEFAEFFNALFKDIEFKHFYEICKYLLEPKSFLNLSAVEQKTILTNITACYLNFSAINEDENLALVRELLMSLFDDFVKNKNIDMALYICMHILHFNADFACKDKMMKAIQKLGIDYAKNLPKPSNAKHEKIRIGFIRDKLSLDTAYKIQYSMLKALLADKKISQKYEFYFYSFQVPQLVEDNAVLMVELIQLGVIFKSPAAGLHAQNKFTFDSLEKVKIIRDEIISDEIDILVDLVGFNEIANFIFSTRTAKKQLYFSYENDDYNIANIDGRASFAALKSTKEFQSKILSVPMDIAKFYDKLADKNLIKATRQMYPKDAFILGGDLSMANERYLRAITQILKDNKNAIFIAFGHNSKFKKLNKLSRVYFASDASLYGGIIDLWLNAFTQNFQNDSAFSYMCKAKPVLNYFDSKILDNYDEKSKAFIQNLCELELVSDGEQGYIQKANELIKSKKMQALLGKCGASFIKQINDFAQKNLIKEFKQIIS